MIKKITTRILRTLEPRDKVYEITDTELKGFTIRVMPSGMLSYSVRYRLRNGRQDRMKIGLSTECTLEQAKDEARKILADVIRGDNPVESRRAARSHTLESFLAEEYWPVVLSKRRRGKEVLARIRVAAASLLSKKLLEVNAWTLEKWRASRLKDGVAAATINKDIAVVKAALSKAVEWNFLDTHPLARLKPLKVDSQAKVRYLDAKEGQRLLNAMDIREEDMRAARDRHNQWCKERNYPEFPNLRDVIFADYLKPMVLLSLNTGMRRGELFSLKWQDINLERAMLTVTGETAKTGKTRHIPLNAIALDVLKQWRSQSDGDGLVFPGKNGERFDNVKNAWKALLEIAEITGFRWHDMRHDFASKLVMAGCDLNTVRELLGHSDIKMTLRYAHLAPEHKAEAVRVLERAGNVVPFERAESA